MAQNSKNTVLKVGSIVIGLAFIMSGGVKLTAPPEMAANFVRWGYPEWFMTLIGGLEVAGGIGLMIPSLAGLAATGLLVIMAGAVFTHLRAGEWAETLPGAILLALTFLIARARHSPVLVRLGLASPPA